MEDMAIEGQGESDIVPCAALALLKAVPDKRGIRGKPANPGSAGKRRSISSGGRRQHRIYFGLSLELFGLLGLFELNG